MTEDEAKTKWCPQVRFVADNGGLTSNREGPGTFCTASNCMAWRWNEDWTNSVHDPVAKTLTITFKDGARVQGGCGLAGAPQ